jgi:hypothetical protein
MPKINAITGEWRKLHDEKLHDLSLSRCHPGEKSRRMRWAGHEECMGERRGTYRVLVQKPEKKRPHVRSMCKWKYNIKTDLKEIGWKVRDWIDLAQDMDRWRDFVIAVMNLRLP